MYSPVVYRLAMWTFPGSRLSRDWPMSSLPVPLMG